MSNSYFQFKQFTIHQDRCVMKVSTDACLFGAWVVNELRNEKPATGGETKKRMLDIGTGTGLLSLFLAQINDHDIIDAIEIDPEACEQAMENTEGSSWCNSIHILHGDARDYPFGKKYDLIISNPPFYENELHSDNEKKNIARHSKNLLLDELLNIIKTNLAATGNFFLLLPYKRDNEIKLILKKLNLFISKRTLVRPSTNHNYFRVMMAGNMQAETKTRETEISIKNNQQQYTPEFAQLLKDYYLYL